MARIQTIAFATLVSLVGCSSSEERAPLEAEPDAGRDDGHRDLDAGPSDPPRPDVDAAAPDAGDPAMPPLACMVEPCFERVVGNGANAMCALSTQGKVWCWGSDGDPEAWNESPNGALGRGEPVTDPILAATPMPVAGLDSVVDLSVGNGNVSCAVRSNGSVWCWGTQPDFGFSSAPALREGLPPADHVVTDTRMGCAVVREDRSPWCWGPSWSPLLPQGSDGSPTRVWKGTRAVRRIGLGVERYASTHDALLLLTEDRSIVSWGTAPGRPSSLAEGRDLSPATIDVVGYGRWVGAFRFIGDDRAYAWCETVGDRVAHALPQLDGTRLLELGERIAVDADGRVFVWGKNVWGELGALPEKLLRAESPVLVEMPAKARSVASAKGGAFCASLVDGSVVCWGRNLEGQLGRRVRDSELHPRPERIVP
jgi:Regulator of chromosome condensation (RCC1) repeat